MSSFFNCAAYDDLVSTIRLKDHIVFLALEDKDKNTSVHLTFNPFQVQVLAQYLSIALTQIDFSGLAKENHFGNLTVQIEQDNLHAEDFDEEEYALAASF